MRASGRTRVRSVLAIGVAIGVMVTPAVMHGWAMDVHRLLTGRAIDGLPADIRPFFVANRDFIVEHSVDPDLWRVMDLKGDRGEESPNHFLDIDFEDGSTAPFTNIPRDYEAYVRKYGLSDATRYGRLPWRAEEVYNRLVSAFTDIGKPGMSYAADNAQYLAAVLSHYIEDAHVPFHGALNYDGQLTNQRGIHSRFEGQLILKNRDTWTWTPVTISDIPDFRAFMFDTVVTSQQLVARVLAADAAAVQGRDRYDDGYFEVLRRDAGPVAERRMNEAVAAVASAIHSAWVAGGRPELPTRTPSTPARIRR